MNDRTKQTNKKSRKEMMPSTKELNKKTLENKMSGHVGHQSEVEWRMIHAAAAELRYRNLLSLPLVSLLQRRASTRLLQRYLERHLSDASDVRFRSESELNHGQCAELSPALWSSYCNIQKYINVQKTKTGTCALLGPPVQLLNNSNPAWIKDPVLPTTTPHLVT